MRNYFLGALLVSVLAPIGCSSSSSNGSSSGLVSPGDSKGSGSSAASGTSGASSSGGSQQGGGAGQLTAGAWDDNLNYDFFKKYYAANAQIAGTPGFTLAEHDASHAEFAGRSPHKRVDAALVIDTTGSMGDEISYLTAEFANISGEIKARFPDADQRWALVLYRDTPDFDENDDYVVKTFDFTGDLAAFTGTIGMQSAGNGGDFPESPELGLDSLEQLSWRPGADVARVAFWVGDAPHHDDRGAGMKQAIVAAHDAGIHLYPVSASGADDLLELSMRSAAQITGGRYLFLTDDSGIGDPHKDPEIPCYFVTKLESALVRVTSMELSGSYVGPATSEIIRTSGSPAMNGTCKTSDGQTVEIF